MILPFPEACPVISLVQGGGKHAPLCPGCPLTSSQGLGKAEGGSLCSETELPFFFFKKIFSAQIFSAFSFFASLIAFNISGTIQYVVFCSWLLLLSVSSSRNQ